MEEAKVAPAAYAPPTANPESGERYIQQTPVWVVVVRGFQIAFSVIILAMCGYLIHGKALDANVFALVVVSSRRPSRRHQNALLNLISA